MLPATAIGVALGILITRQAGRPLRPLTDALVAASQAVPPVVVVALAFPVLGFGTAPTVLALIIYCIMPVLRGTAAALESAQGDATEAARAMGFTASQRLWQVEFPLAIPVIAEALRVAFILAIATAAVGALAGASTLGTAIIIGLQNQNEAYILQGAAATGALAFLDGRHPTTGDRTHARNSFIGPSCIGPPCAGGRSSGIMFVPCPCFPACANCSSPSSGRMKRFRNPTPA